MQDVLSEKNSTGRLTDSARRRGANKPHRAREPPGPSEGKDVFWVPSCAPEVGAMTGRALPLFLLVLLLLLLLGPSAPSPVDTPAWPCPDPCHCFGNATAFCSTDCLEDVPQGIPSGATQQLFAESPRGPVLSGAFANSSALRKLVLLCSPVRSLGQAAFEALPDLRELHLASSELAALASDHLAGLGRLSKLSVPFGLVESLEAGLLRNTPALQALDLQGNQICSLPVGLFHPPPERLEALSLAGNCLAELPARVLEPLARLRALKLSDNRIARLPPDLFRSSRDLRELSLEGNALAELPEGLFAPLAHLRRLQLQHNLLRRLPAALFASLGSLAFLRLDSNLLEELPPGLFRGTPALVELSLAHNRLERLAEGLLGGLPRLSLLALSHNRLGQVPAGAFAGAPALTRLSLSHNNLSALPRGAFANLSHLEHLDLSHNRLAALPEGAFDANEALFAVALGGNPWACDCRLAYLAEWLQTSDPFVHAQALCQSPAHLRGLSLPAMKAEQLVCPPRPPGSARCRAEGQEDGAAEEPPGAAAAAAPPCAYQDPAGALRLSCGPDACHRLSLELPDGEGLQGGRQHFHREWVLDADCGALRVRVTVAIEKEPLLLEGRENPAGPAGQPFP